MQLIQELSGITLLEMKSFPDLATMIRAYMGTRSARTLAELSGVDANAIVRALRGMPMPDEASDQLIKFFRMDERQQEEFRAHVRRARAHGHKAVRAYLVEIERDLESIERLLLKFARLVPQSGPISEETAQKLREVARMILDRNTGSSDS